MTKLAGLSRAELMRRELITGAHRYEQRVGRAATR